MEMWTLCWFSVAIIPVTSVMIQYPPANVTTLTGRDVTFRCDVREKRSTDYVFWKKVSSTDNVSIISYNNNVMIGSKYSIQGSYSLTVNDVRLEDEGWYECQAGVNRARAMLNVQVMIDNMTLTWGTDPPFEWQQLVNLTCHTTNSRPPADITWFHGQTELTGLASTRTTPPDEDGFGNTTSILTIVTGEDIDVLPYRCVATLPNSDNARTEVAHATRIASLTAGGQMVNTTNKLWIVSLAVAVLMTIFGDGCFHELKKALCRNI